MAKNKKNGLGLPLGAKLVSINDRLSIFSTIFRRHHVVVHEPDSLHDRKLHPWALRLMEYDTWTYIVQTGREPPAARCSIQAADRRRTMGGRR